MPGLAGNALGDHALPSSRRDELFFGPLTRHWRVWLISAVAPRPPLRGSFPRYIFAGDLWRDRPNPDSQAPKNNQSRRGGIKLQYPKNRGRCRRGWRHGRITLQLSTNFQAPDLFGPCGTRLRSPSPFPSPRGEGMPSSVVSKAGGISSSRRYVPDAAARHPLPGDTRLGGKTPFCHLAALP